MPRRERCLTGHETNVQELFRFVREATELTNGKLEKLFHFCAADVPTTGRDWGRWSSPDADKRVTPHSRKVNHVLTVVMTGRGVWGGRKVALPDDLFSRIAQALEFSEDPEHHEDCFQGAEQDELDRLRLVGMTFRGMKSRLAELAFLLNPSLHRFAAEQRGRLEAQRDRLLNVRDELGELPRGLILGTKDEVERMLAQVQAAIDSVQEVLPYLDCDSGYPRWVCLDVISRYAQAAAVQHTASAM